MTTKKRRKELENRTIIKPIRFTPSEHNSIKQHSKESGLSTSEYIRRRTLGIKVTSRTDLTMIAQIHKIGVNINQIAKILNQENKVRQVLSLEAELKNTQEALHEIIKEIKTKKH